MSEDNNPYSAPEANVESQQGQGEFKHASRGVRFGNLVLDTVVFYLLLIIVFAVWAMIAPEQMESLVLSAEQGQSLALNFIGIGIMILYYQTFESTMGRTPAKMMTGTFVLDSEGGRPTFSKILGRTLLRFVPFEPFSFLFGPKDRVEGWHDRWSGTKVVKKH